MPNRRAVTRGGAMEAAILENLAQGHSIRAACAAAGVAERTYHRFATNSPAHRHDREVAMAEAERRLVGRVLDAADGGDVKAAQWLLERRWPHAYGALQRLEATVDAHHEVDGEILALATRYSGMDDAQVEAELKKLAWVEPAIQPGAVVGQITTSAVPAEADSIMGGEQVPPIGGGTANLLPIQQPAAATDETPDTAPSPAEVLNHTSAEPLPPQGPLQLRERIKPMACQHCRGEVPGRHEPGCPTFHPDGRIRLSPHGLWGDPR